MNRKITDAGVAGLPIRQGRAELLEEIMTTTPLETDRPQPMPGRARRRALPALAAAAAVLAVIGVIVGATWLGQQREPAPATPVPVADGGGVSGGGGELAALPVPGWVLEYLDQGKRGGELGYRNGEQRLEIMWRPADQYDTYVADRNDIGTPDEVDLLGKTSLMWAYDAHDHTVIRPVGKDFSVEVRGSGMDEPAFRRLLGELRPADSDEIAGLADQVRDPGPSLPPTPERPALLRAPGWSLGMENDQYFYERGRARILVSPVGGVADPFAYDRYQDAEVRKEVTVLGERSLLAEWQENGVRYRVVAVPGTANETTIFEGTGLTRAELLEVLKSAEWVSPEEYEKTVRDGS